MEMELLVIRADSFLRTEMFHARLNFFSRNYRTDISTRVTNLILTITVT